MPVPLVIFLPVRDGGSYLTEAIDSIRAQRCPDWQLVVLENGSTDDTVARVHASGDPRITLVPAPEPLDIRANWQRALTWLDRPDLGDPLITFIGHDDLFAPGFVGTILDLARDHPAATLYQAPFDIIDVAGKLVRPCRPIPERETGPGFAAQLMWGLRDSFGTGYAFRASDHRSVGGWPDLPKLLFSDHLLFIRLAALGYKAASTSAACSYRLHIGSASNAVSRRQLGAQLEALWGFVAAMDADLPDFMAGELGRQALASLLARELAPFHLATASRLLDAADKDRVAQLDARFAADARGLPRALWADLDLGRFSTINRALRYWVNSATLYLRTRRS